MGKNRDFSKFPNAITVLDNGNVGIGTSNPTTKLFIVDSASAYGVQRIQNTATDGYSSIEVFNSSGSQVGAMGYANASAAVTAGNMYTYSSGNIAFLAGGTTERMRITSTGWVGVGTTSPSNYGHGGTNNILEVQNSGTTANSQSHIIISSGATSNTGALGSITFALPNSSAANKRAAIISSDITANSSSAVFANLIFGTSNGSGATERMRITPAGYVGINTNSPQAPLQVVGTGPGGLGTINMRGASAHLGYQDTAGTFKGWVGYFDAGIHGNDVNLNIKTGYKEASNIVFSTNGDGAEAMRIDSSGRVTTPSQPSFLAYNSSGFTVTGGAWYNISNAIQSETYDIGSCYNSSNGRFTAPVAGRYIFYAGGWSSISSNGDRYAFCARVNGGALFYISGGNYSPGDTPLSSYSIVHNLAANDYVDLFLFSALTGNWGGGSHGVYWGGYLL